MYWVLESYSRPFSEPLLDDEVARDYVTCPLTHESLACEASSCCGKARKSFFAVRDRIESIVFAYRKEWIAIHATQRQIQHELGYFESRAAR